MDKIVRPPKVFISYASEDVAQARKLSDDLTDTGAEVWFDRRRLLPGQNWEFEIQGAIAEADYFVALLSSKSVSKKGYVQKELRVALEALDRLPEGKIFLIPARLDPCEPTHPRLRNIHRTDLFDSWARGVAAIARSMGLAPAAEREGPAATVVEPLMVRVPAGDFLIGVSEASVPWLLDSGYRQRWIDWERPQHSVRLSEFWIGKYPVTNAQYRMFLDSDPKWKAGRDDQGGAPLHPVVRVTWSEAAAFCRWLAGQTGKPCRLPTEAEWEKAARGLDGRLFPWGNEWNPHRANTKEKGPGETTPVGLHSPAGDSPYGASDMAGNVSEWCDDWFDGSGYRTRMPGAGDGGDVRANPPGPTGGKLRIVRGGNFLRDAMHARCSSRDAAPPDERSSRIGFRVVWS